MVRSTGVWWENTRRRLVETKMMDGQESKGKGGGMETRARYDGMCVATRWVLTLSSSSDKSSLIVPGRCKPRVSPRIDRVEARSGQGEPPR